MRCVSVSYTHLLGTRFPDMTFAYSHELGEKAMQAAADCGLKLHQGVYCGVNGPQFETPAEIRMFRTLGADAVGMSTVFEVIAAAHCGLPLVGIAMITNMAAGVLMQPLSGAEVNETAERRGAEPVSYTHLDPRQNAGRSVGRCIRPRQRRGSRHGPEPAPRLHQVTHQDRQGERHRLYARNHGGQHRHECCLLYTSRCV